MTKTLDELCIERIVKEQCELRFECIEMLIRKCGLTFEQVSTYVQINASTLYRYKEHKTHMALNKLILLYVSLRKYMYENNIPVDEELQEMIRKTNFSEIKF